MICLFSLSKSDLEMQYLNKVYFPKISWQSIFGILKDIFWKDAHFSQTNLIWQFSRRSHLQRKCCKTGKLYCHMLVFLHPESSVYQIVFLWVTWLILKTSKTAMQRKLPWQKIRNEELSGTTFSADLILCKLGNYLYPTSLYNFNISHVWSASRLTEDVILPVCKFFRRHSWSFSCCVDSLKHNSNSFAQLCSSKE